MKTMNENLVVMKFGGTSVADVDKINAVADRIKSRLTCENCHILVVVSAMGKETDRLVGLSKKISDKPNRRELDMLLTTGERITMALVSMALNERGVPAISFTGSQSGIITDTRHNRARIVDIKANRIEAELTRNKVVIVAGFQGVSQEKEVTTLGRGGSDTTAVALAAALKATNCEIYTDVPGLFAVDPRITADSRKIDLISYDEMIELAGAGCHLLEPRSVIFAKKFDVPLWVGSTFEDAPGTIINRVGSPEAPAVLGMAVNSSETIISLIGLNRDFSMVRAILDELTDNNVPIEVLMQSYSDTNRIDFSFSVPDSDFRLARSFVDQFIEPQAAEEIVTWNSLARISIIGKGMRGVPGIVGTMITALQEVNIPIFIMSTADYRISVFVPRKMINPAVDVVSKAFSLSKSE